MVNSIAFVLFLVLLSSSCALDNMQNLDPQTRLWLQKQSNSQRETFNIMITEKNCLDNIENIQILKKTDNLVIIKASKEDIIKISKLSCVKYIEKAKKIDLKE